MYGPRTALNFQRGVALRADPPPGDGEPAGAKKGGTKRGLLNSLRGKGPPAESLWGEKPKGPARRRKKRKQKNAHGPYKCRDENRIE